MHREIFVPDDHLVASLSRRTAWNGFKASMLARILDRSSLRRVLLAKARIDPEMLLTNEKALWDFVRRSTRLQYHVCGTCRMGRADDPDAVVDSAGRVHGIEGLRVVDASIFPTLPRAYTHFLVIMAAEKIADAVKSDWHRLLNETRPSRLESRKAT
jgi:5-(hydroxymethyl)furfural/furfural oxidase